jgi:hypothetical protein
MSEEVEGIRKREEGTILFGLYGLIGTWLIPCALLTFKAFTGKPAAEALPGAQIVLSAAVVSAAWLSFRFALRAPSWTSGWFIGIFLGVWEVGIFFITCELTYLSAETQDTIPIGVLIIGLVIRLMKDGHAETKGQIKDEN